LCQKSERDGAQRRRCCECEWGRAERQKEGRGGQEGGKEGDGEGGQRGEARREKSEKILIIKATKNPHKLKRYKRTHAAKAHKHTHTGADVVAWLNIRQCVCVCVSLEGAKAVGKLTGRRFATTKPESQQQEKKKRTGGLGGKGT